MLRGRHWSRRAGVIAIWSVIGSSLLSTGLLVRSEDSRRVRTPGEVRVTVLAVGAGSCNVIELPDRRVILIDAGSSSLIDPVGRCIEPMLRSRGIGRIDMLILSHANYDHFSGATELLDLYGVREVLLAPQFVLHASENPAAARLLRTLDATGPPPRTLVAGDRIDLYGDTRIDVLWPHQDADVTANESSLVLRLTHAGRSVLFTGDIESAAQEHLLRDGVDLRADVLISPHHGSFEDTTGNFLRAVAPQCVISSNGRNLSRRQLDFDDIVQVPHHRTHTAGAVTIRLSPDGELTVSPFHRR